jgi:hypothetical protein
MRSLQVKLNHKETITVPFHWMMPFKKREVRPTSIGTYLCRSGRAVHHHYYYRHYGVDGWGLAGSSVKMARDAYKRHGSVEKNIDRSFCWRGFTTEGIKALNALLESS